MSTINEYFEKKNRGSRTASSVPVSNEEPVSYINAYFAKKGGNPIQSTDAAKDTGVSYTPYADAAKEQSKKKGSFWRGLAGLGESAASGAVSGARDLINAAGYGSQLVEPYLSGDDAYYKAMWEQTTGRKTGVEIPEDTRTQEQKDLDEFMGVAPSYTPEARAMKEAVKKGYDKLDETGLIKTTTVGEKYQNNVQERYSDLGGKWQNAMNIAQSVGNQALPLATRYLGGPLGAALSSLVFFGQAYGSAADEATAEGANWAQAGTYGSVIGGIEAATELAGDLAGKALIKAGGKALPKEQFTKALIGTITGNKGLRTVFTLIGQMNGEGLEEVMSDLVSPFAKSIYNGKTPGENWMDEVTLAGLWQSYLGGAISGAILSGITGSASGQFRAQNEIYANEVVSEKIAEARTAAKEDGAFSEKTREKIIDAGTEIEALEQRQTEAARAAREAQDAQKLLRRAMRGDAGAAAELEQRMNNQNSLFDARTAAGADFEAETGANTAEAQNAAEGVSGTQRATIPPLAQGTDTSLYTREAGSGIQNDMKGELTNGQSTYYGRENGAADLRTGGEGLRAEGREGNDTGGQGEVRQSLGEYAQADLRQVTPAQLGIKNGGSEAVTLVDAQKLGGEAKSAAELITASGREAVAVRGAIQVGTGYANAYVENGKVYFRVDATDAAGNPISPKKLAQHELFHEYVNDEVLDRAADFIRESMTAGEFDAMKESYRTAYASIYDLESMSEAEIERLMLEEIAADAYAGLNRFSEDTAVSEAVRAETEQNAPAQRAEAQQDSTGPPRFSLNTYSEQQKANWNQSRKILVYENAEQLKNFVEKARADSGYVSKIYFGTVDGELAAEIMNETGYDLRGKNVTLRADNVRKIFKDHGQERTEAPRGQRPVTAEDFARIPDVIGNPDSITEGDYFGKQAVEFKKVIDGSRITVFAVDSGGSSLDLYVQTMYAGKKKGSIADTANASALTQTPKTPAGTASFDSNIRSSSADSQEKSSGRAAVAGINARTADREALQRAEALEKSGTDNETIRQETGWYRGMDGKWRFEIDDSGMEFRRDGDAQLMKEEGYRRLNELTDRWEKSFENGAELSEAETREMERLQDEYKDAVWEEKFLLRDFVKHDALFDAYPKLKTVNLAFDTLPDGTTGYFSRRDNTIVLSDSLFGKEADAVLHEIQHVIQKTEDFSGGASPQYWNDRMENGFSKRRTSGEEMMPGELYRNTAGEIEARDTANRRRLTAEERRKTPPDLGDADTVFADGATAYSINENFEKDVDDWLKNTPEDMRSTSHGYFRVGTTSEALQSIGARTDNIYMRKSKIGTILEEHPEIDAGIIKSVPNMLENPVLVMKSLTRPDSIVVFGEEKARNGSNLMVALELTPKPGGRTEMEFSLVTSAYGRSDANVQNLINNSELLYLDPNKKRADTWLMQLRVQFPSGQPQYGSIGSIAYAENGVKITGKKLQELGGKIQGKSSGRASVEVEDLTRGELKREYEGLKAEYDERLARYQAASSRNDEAYPYRAELRWSNEAAKRLEELEKAIDGRKRRSVASTKRDIMKLFSVDKANRAEIEQILNREIGGIMKDGKITNDTADRMLDRLLEAGRFEPTPENSPWMDETFVNIRNDLRGKRIYVSQQTWKDFGADEAKSLRARARRAGITLTRDRSNTTADMCNMELAEAYGESIFPTDIAETDMLRNIIDAAERGERAKQTLAERLWDEARLAGGDQKKAYNEAVQELRGKMVTILREFAEDNRIDIDTETIKPKIRRAPESSKRKDYRISVHRYSDSPAATVTVTNDATGQKERVYIADAQELSKTEMNAYGEKQIREMMKRNAAEAEKREVAAYEAAREETKRKRTYEPIQAVGEYTEKLVEMEAALETADNAVMEEGKNRYEARIAEEDGDVYAYVYKNGELLAKAKGKNRKRATHWVANQIRADFGERTVFHPALQERGDYELDRKKAQKDGYPKLTKTNGERAQTVPFWTWVRSRSRKNYGLVVGVDGNRIGPDGQKVVDVYYYNKQTGKGIIVPENAETVYAVDGQYSDMYAEEKAKARMNDEAAETLRAESTEKDREAQKEGSPFEPGSNATTDGRILRTRNTSMGASEIFRKLISDGHAEVKTQTADSKIAEYSVKTDTNGVEHWADVFENGKKKERFIESTAEDAAMKAAEYVDEEANKAFTAANAERAARQEAEEAAEYDAKIAELFGEPEPGERKASEIIFPTRKPIMEETAEETAEPTPAEKAESRVAGEAVAAERDFRERMSDFTGSMMRMFVNAGDTVRRIAKATGDKSLEGYYFNAGAYSQRAGNWIAKGGARTDMSGKKIGASLEDVLAPMRENAETYRDFQLYLLHMHNVDRMKYDNTAELDEIAKRIGEIEDTFKELKGMPNEYIQRTAGDLRDKASSMSQEEMAAVLEEMKGGEPLRLMKIKDAAQLLLYARDRQRIIQRQGLKPVFGYDVSAYDSQQAAQKLAEAHPEFKDWAKEIYEYSDDLISYRVEAGMLTEKAAEAMKKRYPHYVPTLRVEGTTGKTARKARRNGGITVSNALGRAVGSDAVLLPLHTALSRKTVSVMRNAGMNQLGLRLVRLWEEQNGTVGKYIENVKESEYTATEADFEGDELFRRIVDNTMNVIDGGKRYEIRMDEGLTTAMNAQQPDRFANYAAAKGLKKLNDLFKALCTGYNPFFMARNLVRDMQDAGFYSTDAKTWAKMYPAAVKQIAQNGEIWQQYKALGGSYASMLDYATGLTKAPKNRLGKVWEKYEALGQAIEAAPRLAEFMTTLANKGGSKTVNGVKTGEFTTSDYMEAMLGAADITTNFARGGTVTKALNRYIVPFLNPSVQGFDKFVRNATETKGVKAAGKLVWKAALMGIAPTILNALMYAGNDEWDEIPDQTKANYYLINFGNGYWLKIPRGRAIAVFSSLAVYGQEKMQGDDPKLSDVFEVIKSNVAPTDIFNQNIATALTQTKLLNPDNPGTTWYGGNIESDRLQNYRPGERYDEKTDELSKLIGKAFNISPKKLNYLLDQYTGVIGDFLLPWMTKQATASTPLLAPAKSAFMIDTTNTNKVTGEYYDLLDDLKYDANDGDTAADITRRYVNHAGDEVNDYYQQVREIQNDENLEKAEKNRLVRALKQQLIARQEEIISDAEVYREAVETYLRENPEYATDNGAAVAEFAELYDITEEQAESRMEAIVYREANREVFGAEYALKTYSSDVYDKAKTAYAKGVSWDTYYDYYFATKDMRADKDENGKSISGTKKAKVVEYINGLDIPAEQKDALYIAAGYTETSTKNQPWNGGSGKSSGRRGGKRSTLKAPEAPKAAKITIPEAGTATGGAKTTVKVADIAGAVDTGKIRKAAQKTAKTAIKAGNRTVYIEEGSPLDYFLKTGRLPSTK